MVTLRAVVRFACLIAVCCASDISISLLEAPPARAATGAMSKHSARERPQYQAGLLGVTTQDVQRILSQAKSESDTRLARRLLGLVLTERMSSAQLESLEKGLRGAKSRRALMALADASAFLMQPSADIASQPAPSLEEQRRIIALAVDYLGKTLPKLPNLSATENIVRFDDDSASKKHARAGTHDTTWHWLGGSQAIVTYRNGKEIVDPRAWGKRPSYPEGQGLITRGIFGPILSTVFVDAAHGETTWDHWERAHNGLLAVFRYRVPQTQSHYAVAFQGSYVSSGQADSDPPMGYHGEIAIDPATGTILRLIVQADPPLGSPILRGDILVEYGPVVIAGKTYTCPLRSVSISLQDFGFLYTMQNPFNGFTPTGKPQLLMNDATFTNYHIFRSDSRILTGFTPP